MPTRAFKSLDITVARCSRSSSSPAVSNTQWCLHILTALGSILNGLIKWTFLHMIDLLHFVHKRKIRPKSSTLILAKITDFGWLKGSFWVKLCQHKLNVTFNYLLTKFEENLYKFLRIIKERNCQEFLNPHSIYIQTLGFSCWYYTR